MGVLRHHHLHHHLHPPPATHCFLLKSVVTGCGGVINCQNIFIDYLIFIQAFYTLWVVTSSVQHSNHTYNINNVTTQSGGVDRRIEDSQRTFLFLLLFLIVKFLPERCNKSGYCLRALYRADTQHYYINHNHHHYVSKYFINTIKQLKFNSQNAAKFCRKIFALRLHLWLKSL